MNMSEISKNIVQWDADSAAPELAEKVRTGLQEVRDPELGLSVIQLGLVRNISITDEHVLINMILTTPYCPYGPAMLEQVRSKVEEILGKKTDVELGVEPWDFTYMDDEAEPTWGMF